MNFAFSPSFTKFIAEKIFGRIPRFRIERMVDGAAFLPQFLRIKPHLSTWFPTHRLDQASPMQEQLQKAESVEVTGRR